MKAKLLALAALVAISLTAVAAVPASSHVVVVVEENHSYANVIGNPAMPYLNSLANSYSLLTAYYADAHPSIGNYFEMTTGNVITNNDSFTSTISNDNIVRHLLTAGKTWKSYAESLPSVGYTGGNTGYYFKRHDPFAYFSDVANSSVEKQRLVPFTQFSKDLANHALPNFSFIAPNILHDAHDGTLAAADAWLKANIAPLLSNSEFTTNGLLIIVFDESVVSDTAHGGGHVAAIVIGPKVKRGFKYGGMYKHESTLRTILDALGVNHNLGNAATATPFNVF
ncbi:phosphoesterase [Candidatus Koribacter versatilis Ellin345]|uniref:Phosphoesterase n=1 Tax=Koribacter versatilis (strain Ellin345) TaxID=204669 RepID=Q1IR81_KORVE|nr:alkaline phosphatase family protein [Candidatus Koribacter versatilis]ABF40619.1 phosphoesterase [Candidatus Koribacter versatilis Ellin345]